MGNRSSADSSEPQYVDYATTTTTKKPSRKTEKVPTQRKTEQHGGGGNNKAVYNNNDAYDDDTFTKYIQRAKYKIKRLSTVGRRHHEEQHKPAAPDHHHHHHVPRAGESDSNKDKNEAEQFSHFIQNVRKKLTTTVSTLGKKKNSSFRKYNDEESGH